MECSYKFRIYPSKEQIEQINKNFGCVRFVYNYFLAKRKEEYKTSKTIYDYNKCSAELTQIKKEYTWLKDADSTSLQSALKDLEYAFLRYANDKTVSELKYKTRKSKKNSYKSKNTNKHTSIRLTLNGIRLPKLGVVKCKISKKINGTIVSATVLRSSVNKYYVSICCINVEHKQLQKTGNSVGIDLGVKDLVVTSDGDKYCGNKYYRNLERKLVKRQRQLSRKTRGSKNWEKARIKFAKICEHISNQRIDTMQKITTKLMKKYDVICIENLSPLNMMKNHCLSKSISDASFGEFRRELEYKAKWYGKNIVVIDKYFPSSQKCSNCGNIYKKMKDLSQREWMCPICFKRHDRDINAAINILHEGQRMLQL